MATTLQVQPTARPALAAVTARQYLELEMASPERAAFLDNEIVPMSGASFFHNTIHANLSAYYTLALRKLGFQAFGPDLRVNVGIEADDMGYTYPDYVIVQGKPQFEPNQFYNLLNPYGVVEILSETTMHLDVVRKGPRYQRIPSLQQLVFIDQYRMWVEVRTRTPQHTWELTTLEAPTEVLRIAGAEATLAQVYEGVDFSQPEPGAAVQP
jgi:Uma2 family endonuclease